MKPHLYGTKMCVDKLDSPWIFASSKASLILSGATCISLVIKQAISSLSSLNIEKRAKCSASLWTSSLSRFILDFPASLLEDGLEYILCLQFLRQTYIVQFDLDRYMLYVSHHLSLWRYGAVWTYNRWCIRWWNCCRVITWIRHTYASIMSGGSEYSHHSSCKACS